MDFKNLKFVKTIKNLSPKLRWFMFKSIQDYKIGSKYIDYLIPDDKKGIEKDNERLENMVRETLAKEFGSRNIRVNAVCPGFIQTAMTAELPNIDEYLKAIPMKRLGTPEDIAKVVKFLALDTDYVTGQAIEVAGGLMI